MAMTLAVEQWIPALVVDVVRPRLGDDVAPVITQLLQAVAPLQVGPQVPVVGWLVVEPIHLALIVAPLRLLRPHDVPIIPGFLTLRHQRFLLETRIQLFKPPDIEPQRILQIPRSSNNRGAPVNPFISNIHSGRHINHCAADQRSEPPTIGRDWIPASPDHWRTDQWTGRGTDRHRRRRLHVLGKTASASRLSYILARMLPQMHFLELARPFADFGAELRTVWWSGGASEPGG